MKVFLGGTQNDSTWRDNIIPRLEIDYFNPNSEKIKNTSDDYDFYLYVITPKMQDEKPIEEVSKASAQQPDKTIFCYLLEDEGPVSRFSLATQLFC